MIWLTCTLIIHFTSSTSCTSLLSHSCSCTITTCSSITKTFSLWPRQFLGTLSCTLKWSTQNTESKCLDATCSTSTCKWELMNWSLKDLTCLKARTWKSGYGTLQTCKKLWLDAIDSHGKMTQVISQILSCCCKTSSEDTLTILLRSHFKSGSTRLVCDQSTRYLFKHYKRKIFHS